MQQMTKVGVALLLVVWSVGLVGCGRQPAVSNTSATASASRVSTPTSSQTPSPTSQSALACRLPVFTASQAGWLSFPNSIFQADSKGNVQLPGYSSSEPFLALLRSYDKAYERWLPVPRDWISPDGQHYAYADPPAAPGQPKLGGVHVVDLASRADHLFRPAAEDWVVLDYEAEGVYLTIQQSVRPPYGLWLLDPSGQRAFRQLDNTSPPPSPDALSHSWQYISGGGAWGTTDPLTGHGAGPGSRLLRLDLNSGVITSWYKRSDIEFLVTGADGTGHPLLQTIEYYPNQLLLVTGQNSATTLQAATGSHLPRLSNYIHPVSDANGLWLGDTQGAVSLYTPAAGVRQLASVGTSDVLVAGGCH